MLTYTSQHLSFHDLFRLTLSTERTPSIVSHHNLTTQNNVTFSIMSFNVITFSIMAQSITRDMIMSQIGIMIFGIMA